MELTITNTPDDLFMKGMVELRVRCTLEEVPGLALAWLRAAQEVKNENLQDPT